MFPVELYTEIRPMCNCQQQVGAIIGSVPTLELLKIVPREIYILHRKSPKNSYEQANTKNTTLHVEIPLKKSK